MPDHVGQPNGPFSLDSVFYDFFELNFENDHRVLWVMMRPDCPPKFTRDVLHGLRAGQTALDGVLRQAIAENNPSNRVNYQVLGSKIPGVFSRGGDLVLFRQLIASQDKDALLEYAVACIDVLYTNATNYGMPITTISLVQGDALGGGFEAAMAANVVVAERGCKMGLPEIMFNLFPGMGAYHLLLHRLTPVKAEQFITSGRTYLAQDLYHMGLVDILAEAGKGVAAVQDYIRTTSRQLSARHGLRAAMLESDFLNYDHLRRTAAIWVDTALKLAKKDVGVMDFLIRAQSHHAADPTFDEPFSV